MGNRNLLVGLIPMIPIGLCLEFPDDGNDGVPITLRARTKYPVWGNPSLRLHVTMNHVARIV